MEIITVASIFTVAAIFSSAVFLAGFKIGMRFVRPQAEKPVTDPMELGNSNPFIRK